MSSPARLHPPDGDPGWYREAVFYEVLVRGFFDSNEDGAGDLRGLTAKLDYLSWLGIDCLWIGHFDLSVSLGIPGQFDHPKFLKAVERTIAATKKHKKALGRLVPTTEVGIALYKQGFDFCCYSGDAWVLRDALAAAITTLRKGCMT